VQRKTTEQRLGARPLLAQTSSGKRSAVPTMRAADVDNSRPANGAGSDLAGDDPDSGTLYWAFTHLF
jgi:hypothetical protein